MCDRGVLLLAGVSSIRSLTWKKPCLSSVYVATALSVARQAQAVNVPSSSCATHASQPLSCVEHHNRIGCVCWWSVTSLVCRSSV